jgi:pyruvate carboxylase
LCTPCAPPPQACADNGIVFVGPTVENLNTFADKTSARNVAIAAGAPPACRDT